MKSIWYESAPLPTFSALDSEASFDVLIIGGGLAGILTAYELSRHGVSYALIESERICSKTTLNTTAKITAQHALIYDKITKEFDTDTAKGYYEINRRAIFEYKRLAADIDCDFETISSFVYSRRSRAGLEAEMRALERIGAECELRDTSALPISVMGALEMKEQAQFNPIKFVSHIAHGLNIFENTRAISIHGSRVRTNRGIINAEKIIVATHFPFMNTHGSYFLKMHQERSYVLALRGAENVVGAYIDEKKGGLSFRNYGELLLLGGGSHRTGEESRGWEDLRAFAKKHYPHAREEAQFATQDCITLDGIPYIGRYSMLTPDIFVATGFNKWGMTSSMVSALILSDLVRDKENEYARIFSPSRTVLRKSLLVNIGSAATNILTLKTPRCPHLGCALKYNRLEHSWDCPCHGSRFDKDGRLLNGPATEDKPKLKRAGENRASENRKKDQE